mmetsp:Transcript_54241/g.150918  ORF Transcript_54241/g.150918 Transcript_54241/m.150918 type:complete len:566 (+) Transcript_54241:45-1742(+)
MADLAEINDLLRSSGTWHRSHAASVRCQRRAGQGRILVAARSMRRGDVILADRALSCVGTPSPGTGAAEVFAQLVHWHRRRDGAGTGGLSEATEQDISTVWCALHGLLAREVPADWPLTTWTPELQHRALLLHSSGRKPSASTRQLRSFFRLSIAVEKLEQLMEVWELNSFGHTTHEDITCLFFSPAFANHSCMPTASWYIAGDTMELRAMVDLAEGDEITDSYIEDEDLLACTARRRRRLLESGKAFRCLCKRCRAAIDMSRGAPCPSCGVGVVFIGTTDSDDRDILVKPRSAWIGTQHTNQARQVATQQMSSWCNPSRCTACGHCLSEAEEALLVNIELKIEARLHQASVSQEPGAVLERCRRLMKLHLGETTHWLSRVVHGLLKNVAEDAGDVCAELELLDLRAAFVRNAFGRKSASGDELLIPCPTHAWELEEAARLCLRKHASAYGTTRTGKDQPLFSCSRTKARAAARADARWRLEECLAILRPMFGPGNEDVRRVSRLLQSLHRRKAGGRRLRAANAGVRVQHLRPHRRVHRRIERLRRLSKACRADEQNRSRKCAVH